MIDANCFIIDNDNIRYRELSILILDPSYEPTYQKIIYRTQFNLSRKEIEKG